MKRDIHFSVSFSFFPREKCLNLGHRQKNFFPLLQFLFCQRRHQNPTNALCQSHLNRWTGHLQSFCFNICGCLRGLFYPEISSHWHFLFFSPKKAQDVGLCDLQQLQERRSCQKGACVAINININLYLVSGNMPWIFSLPMQRTTSTKICFVFFHFQSLLKFYLLRKQSARRQKTWRKKMENME